MANPLKETVAKSVKLEKAAQLAVEEAPETASLESLVEKYIDKPTAKKQWQTRRRVYGPTGRTAPPKKHPMRHYDLSVLEEAHAWAKAKYGERYDPAAAERVWRKTRLGRGLPV